MNDAEGIQSLEELSSGFMKTQVLYAAAKLGIADSLLSGPQSSEQLAMGADAHPGALYRLLRALEYLGLVVEPQPGTFALTAAGRHLCQDAPGGFRNEILFQVEMSWQLWGQLYYSIKTGDPATFKVLGMSYFDYLQQNPQQASAFHEAMTRLISTMAKGVVASYDFSPFETIVDIGGGQGTLMMEILESFPGTRGILFDMPITMEGARQRIRERGLEKRCECVGGDFFEKVPGGDAMILSAVISDWDDAKSIQILSNCRSSISPQGRLLLLERLLVPEDPAPSTVLLDLMMHLIGGGTGRSASEYRHLLREAGFEMIRVVPTGTQRIIFEARPVL